jgi:hypothetical protein
MRNSSTLLRDIALHFIDRRDRLAPREFPKTIAVGADALTRYAGTYKLREAMNIVVRANAGKIAAQATGQEQFEILAESETRIFAKVAPIVMTFVDVADGKSGSFLLEQGGGKMTARRIP